MKASITEADRRRIGEWITDAQQLLEGIETIKGQIAHTLGLDPTEDHDAITDAVMVPQTVDGLLLSLHIDIEEPD